MCSWYPHCRQLPTALRLPSLTTSCTSFQPPHRIPALTKRPTGLTNHFSPGIAAWQWEPGKVAEPAWPLEYLPQCLSSSPPGPAARPPYYPRVVLVSTPAP